MTPQDPGEAGEPTDLLALVDGLDAIVWEADPATMRFTFVSRRAERILGYPLEAWRDLGFWFGLIHPDEREARVAERLREIERGRDHASECRVVAADGRLVWMRDSARLVAGEAGAPPRLRGVMVDVTDRKAVEAALRESEAEQAALRRVATAVAGERTPSGLMDLVAREAARLLDASHGLVFRYQGRRALGVGRWSADEETAAAATLELPLEGGSTPALVARAWRPVRHLDPDAGSAVGTPIRAGAAPWGALVVTAEAGRVFPADAEARLARLAALVAMAVAATEQRRSLARHAREQASLGRLARRAAEGADPETVFAEVAREAARLLDVQRGLVARFDEGHAQVVGASGPGAPAIGSRFPLRGDGAIPRVARLGSPARVGDYAALALGDPTRERAARHDHRSGVAAPVRVGGRLWGATLAAATAPDAFGPDAEARMLRFAELVAVAIASAEDRAELAARAARDPLTGLANHRAFQERLTEEFERARRHGRRLSLALLDIDRFREVNDRHGHQAGDEVLAEVARRLADASRPGDLLARAGGEEFGWILPESDGLDAWQVAERARQRISDALFLHGERVTVSAGVSDIAGAHDATDLYRLAGGALYWAKAHGRDVCFRYSPQVVAVLSAEERAQRLEREQALTSVRLLARVVDAKDPHTRRHSERVAELAVQLAGALGWSVERSVALREAGLVHDVGKVGVPDAVLFKPGRLTSEEYEELKQHAALGAQLVSEVLSPDQVGWVRHHHERIDGAGYPAGLAGDEIPDGARILALADAWDVMTQVRHYTSTISLEDALEECRREAGRQFCREAVGALERLSEAGKLSAGRRPALEGPQPLRNPRAE